MMRDVEFPSLCFSVEWADFITPKAGIRWTSRALFFKIGSQLLVYGSHLRFVSSGVLTFCNCSRVESLTREYYSDQHKRLCIDFGVDGCGPQISFGLLCQDDKTILECVNQEIVIR
jgi:hypothetical protein